MNEPYIETYRLILPRHLADIVRASKPDDVDELMLKSTDFIDTAVFVLTNIGPHLEWMISLYWQLKDNNDDKKYVRLVRNADGEEAEFTNMSAEDIAQILREWARDE